MHRETLQIGAAEITLETGRVARQAHGAVVVRQGDAWLLATVVAGPDLPGPGFLPLTVEYREKAAAAGRIPGNFFRRETRLGEHEVLTSRLIDRTLRPLIADGFRAEVQVSVTVFSADEQVDLAGLALLGAAAALHLSDVPFDGPVAGLRLVRTEGAFVPFPSRAQAAKADLDLMVSAGRGGLVMVEGEARGVPEAELLDAFDAAAELMGPALDGCDRLRAAAGRPKRDAKPAPTPAWVADLQTAVGDAVDAALRLPGKAERRGALADARADALAACADRPADAVEAHTEALIKKRARALLLDGGRMDGRAHDAVRDITCEMGTLPTCHGSALFTRGETQVLVSATLAGGREAQDLETVYGLHRETFILHYNFPSYSVGEARPNRGPGRREIGHGNLARRALDAVLPPGRDWPFTLRVVSDVTESNGSSSMATVCGGTLAMLHAGVPLKAPVAGIAMGLVVEGDRIAVLTDILGDEDHLGDMDFKVAGTADGVTAVQMDNKVGSLSRDVLARALEQARAGRAHILEKMQATIDATPANPNAPAALRWSINPARIGAVIGSKGSVLQGIQSRTGAKVDISDDGTVTVLGKNAQSARAARKAIDAITMELVKGGLYLGEVTNVKNFGAFVRVAEHEGLVHVSELEDHRVEDATTVVQPGQEMLVRVLGADDKGRLKLSRKAALGESPLEALNA
ncbi:MAG: polyribonucleotide nucleotidyltransferase [Myxococcales bacterium]|nr:polyribonucleotide nucleotidyltransferase [Myxococcales bacterium]